MDEIKDLDDASIPPLTDSKWSAWTSPLREFLAKPRDWKDLDAWFKSNRMGATFARNCIAWLENKGLIMSFDRDGKVVWVNSAIRAEDEEPPAEALVSTQG